MQEKQNQNIENEIIENEICQIERENATSQKLDLIIKKWEDLVENKSKNSNRNSNNEDLEMKYERPYVYKSSDSEEHDKIFDDGFLKNNLCTKSANFTSDKNDKILDSKTSSNYINEKLIKLSPMRMLCGVQKISNNYLEVVVSKNNFESGWVDAKDERKDGDEVVDIKKIMTHEVYAQPIITKRVIEDSYIDVSSWLTDKLIDLFASSENNAFIKGDGQKMPFGILSSEKVKTINTSEKDRLEFEDIITLINSMDQKYLVNATFLMHRQTLSMVQGIKDKVGRFIWQPGLSSSPTDTLFGIPVVCCDDMNLFSSNEPSIILADFKLGYKIIEKEGITVMQDPYTTKHLVKFYATKKVGGDIVDPEAIKFMKNSEQ